MWQGRTSWHVTGSAGSDRKDRQKDLSRILQVSLVLQPPQYLSGWQISIREAQIHCHSSTYPTTTSLSSHPHTGGASDAVDHFLRVLANPRPARSSDSESAVQPAIAGADSSLAHNMVIMQTAVTSMLESRMRLHYRLLRMEARAMVIAAIMLVR